MVSWETETMGAEATPTLTTTSRFVAGAFTGWAGLADVGPAG